MRDNALYYWNFLGARMRIYNGVLGLWPEEIGIKS